MTGWGFSFLMVSLVVIDLSILPICPLYPAFLAEDRELPASFTLVPDSGLHKRQDGRTHGLG